MTPQDDNNLRAKQALDRWLAMVYRMVRAQLSREARNAARHAEQERKERDGDY